MHSLHDLASLYAFSNLLSVKWANANLGASSPGDYGGYYQWAGTEDVSDTSIILKWNNCPYHIISVMMSIVDGPSIIQTQTTVQWITRPHSKPLMMRQQSISVTTHNILRN